MLNSLIGDATSAAMLKDALDASSARVRAIAHRVSNSATPTAAGGFAEALQSATEAGEVEAAFDLEAEMVGLAEEQLRFEAATRLLQKIYAQVHASVRER